MLVVRFDRYYHLIYVTTHLGKNMKNFRKLAVILAASTIFSSANVAADTVAIGPKIGTQGIGVDARVPVYEGIFGRIGFNYFSYSKNFNDGKIEHKGKLKLFSAPLMLDWHPFQDSGFKLSAGVAYNGNKLDASATPTKSVTLEGRTFTPAQLGTVSAKLKLGSSVAGIASLGYDSSFISSSPWSFNFEAGIMYSGNPKIEVSSTGLATDAQPLLQRDAEKSLDDIKKFMRYYPVLSLGFRYSF